jgi:Predicted membrane protein
LRFYLAVLKKYAVFKGRARRKEFWMFCLFTLIIAGAFNAIGYAVGLGRGLNALYSLGTFVPSLAVLVRRLHDTNRKGMLALLMLTGIGAIVLLVFAAQEGTSGENQYGPDPKKADI